jgi:hypothetical protein
MPILKSIQSGNFTDSSTWAVVDQNSFLYQTTNGIAVPFSTMEGSNFTVSSNITISGVMLQIAARTPVAPGNFVVRFHNVTTATDLKIVTVNAADLPNNENGSSGSRNVGWAFFKFDAPITLSTTQTYRLRLSASNGTNIVAVYGTAGNTFDRALVTTTNAAPGASDTLIVNGEYTAAGVNSRYIVTMNNTSSATAYGQTFVDCLGTLRWANTSSSTFHLRLVNNLLIRGAGELIIGDDTAPIPASTTCSLEITCSSPGQFSIFLGSTGKIITRGAETIVKSEISSTINPGATSFTTAITTDWVIGDRIVIAGTSRSSAQVDALTIASRSGNTINVTTPFSFEHLGVGDTIADVGKLNRNVRIFSTSVTNYFNLIQLASNYCSVNFNYTELFDFGFGSAGMISGTNFSDGLVNIRNSSMHSTTNRGVTMITYAGNSYKINTVDNNIFYNTTLRAISGTLTSTQIVSSNFNFTVTNNLAINTGGFSFPINGNFDNNIVCAAAISGNEAFQIINHFSGSINNTKIYGTINGLTFNGAITVSNTPVNNGNVINNITLFRFAGINLLFNNVLLSSGSRIIFNNIKAFGGGGGTTALIGLTNTSLGEFVINDSYFYGGSGQVAGTMIGPRSSSNSQNLGRLIFNNCKFGLDTNNNPSNFSSYILNLSGVNNILMNNCIFSGTEASGASYPMERVPGIVSLNHNGVTGATRIFKSSGILIKDTSIVTDKPSSVRLIPQLSAFNSISEMVRIPVKQGDTPRISVKVRKSAAPDTAYNGTQPRLIYVYNPASGNLSNTVAATATSSNGVWETLTYTVPAVISDTVLEFYVSCNGTAGFINISDWETPSYNDSKSNEYYGSNGLYIEPTFGNLTKSYVFLI